MRNGLLILLAGAVCVLGYINYTQAVAIRTIADKLNRSDKSANLALQEKCADQALRIYKGLGYNTSHTGGFLNHYNEKLNKCFEEIDDTTEYGGTFVTSREVSDAFEGKVYGSYMKSSSRGISLPSVDLVDCTVQLLSGQRIECHSSDEFDRLITQFFQ